MNELIKKEDLAVASITKEQKELLKRTVAKGTTDDELLLFMTVANRAGLDPFRKQIFAIKRLNRQENRYEMAIQTGIEGFRLIAGRSGKLRGYIGPFWCDKSGEWKDVWLKEEPPVAAKVSVLVEGFQDPVVGVANFKSFVQSSYVWKQMPEHMLAKCAEALAIRRAFPQETMDINSATIDNNEEIQTVQAQIIKPNFPPDSPPWEEMSLSDILASPVPINKLRDLTWQDLLNNKEIPGNGKYQGREYLKKLAEWKDRPDLANLAKRVLDSALNIVEIVQEQNPEYTEEIE